MKVACELAIYFTGEEADVRKMADAWHDSVKALQDAHKLSVTCCTDICYVPRVIEGVEAGGDCARYFHESELTGSK
jgi:hypothetical protein